MISRFIVVQLYNITKLCIKVAVVVHEYSINRQAAMSLHSVFSNNTYTTLKLQIYL
jgi:hypothetical protein